MLLVEDNQLNRELVCDLLGDLGWTVIAVADAASGIERAKAEPFDGILMDLSLPDLDGLSAVGILKAEPRCRDVPVVAFTAHAMPEDRRRALAAGCCEVVTKPIDIRALPDQLRTAFGRKAAK